MPAIPPHTLKVYDATMKYFLLAIFVLIAAQPLQASYCDMCDGQDSGQSQHGNMHEGSMDHEMQDMDCCDHEPADDPKDSDDGCNSMSHCGACPTGLAAVSSSIINPVFTPSSQQIPLEAEEPLSISSSPPFRPPIA